jgi:hypothetical protein
MGFEKWLNNLSLKITIRLFIHLMDKKSNPNIYVGVLDLEQPKKMFSLIQMQS